MAYYNVVIVYRKGRNERGRMVHRTESEYFGEDQNMMYVRFFEAVRKATTLPDAESVFVWLDGEILARVKIEH